MSEQCPACRSEEWNFRFKKQGFDFVEWSNCHLLKLAPLPTKQTLIEHYAARASAGNYRRDSTINIIPILEEMFEFGTQYFQRTWLEYADDKRVFDIGCLYGDLLDVAKIRGWETWGIELQPQAAEIAAEKHCGRVVCADADDFAAPRPGYFDMVMATGLIEHVRNPRRVIHLAAQLLRKDGVLLIQTPNRGSLPAKIMGRYWPPIAAPEHVHYFCTDTIRRIGDDFGFSIISSKAHWKTLRVGYVLDQLSFFGEELSRVTNAVRPIIPKFAERISLPFYGGEMLMAMRKTTSQLFLETQSQP